MAVMRLLLLYLFLSAQYYLILSETDTRDAAALLSLRDQWEHTPQSWNNSDDPCGSFWEGVTCNRTRITQLSLSTMGLSGNLSSNIGGLPELTLLDLSFNPDLTGSLPQEVGNLQKLEILVLAGCSFTGNIPNELGNLTQLSFLALNSNNFSGEIPCSLGNLTKLFWLDLADNQLTGSIPISTPNAPGLDLLKQAKHFHLNKNQLTGTIPAKLFSSDMLLLHLLLDGNNLAGEIPPSLAFVQSLEVLNLANNMLSGTLPDLSGLHHLNFVDLSNNSFQQSPAPAWFSTLQSLTTLVLEYGSLEGEVPEQLFSLPQIQLLNLKNNAFNGTLDMGRNVSQHLQFVDLANNEISSVTLNSGYNNTLILIGNPVCSSVISTNSSYCQNPQHAFPGPR
ncbi:hypothetical protein M9H77_28097 [Catharanthus roseus]|uniref:Uncharacterized protein n=1 Tax=Catharanthus roseus TaxID=4058 RepID=A0ACC0AER5_CATRO|nr:hypothetical protein M9H77_28097 [Catharanthus roseus]